MQENWRHKWTAHQGGFLTYYHGSNPSFDLVKTSKATLVSMSVCNEVQVSLYTCSWEKDRELSLTCLFSSYSVVEGTGERSNHHSKALTEAWETKKDYKQTQKPP
jgi:hypothetical protein